MVVIINDVDASSARQTMTDIVTRGMSPPPEADERMVTTFHR